MRGVGLYVGLIILISTFPATTFAESMGVNLSHGFGVYYRSSGHADFARHIHASHLAMRGASPKDLQELLGHKTMSMTTRYAHLSQEHKKKAVNLLNGLTAPQQATNEDCHIWSHFDNHQSFAIG